MSKWMASRQRRGFCLRLMLTSRQRLRAKERTIPPKERKTDHRFAKDGYIFLAKNDLRPASGVRAPRWLWTCLRTISLQARRMARGNIHPSQQTQKSHSLRVACLLWRVSDLDAKPCVANLDARLFCGGYTNPRAFMGVACDRYLPGRNAMLATSPMYFWLFLQPVF